MNTIDAHVAHGYTMTDIARLARVGVAKARTSGGTSKDRYQAAWDAVVLALAEADKPPTGGALTVAAAGAVEDAWHDHRHHHGITNAGRSASKHAVYWLDLCAPTPSPEPRAVEHLALTQIWGQLNDNDRQALTALATMGTYQAAADALELDYRRFANRVRAARRRFLDLWHEGETPSRLWRVDRRERTVSLFGEDNPNRYYTIRKGVAIGQRKPSAEHGTWKRYCGGCKCEPCKAAAQVYNKAQYDRRKAARLEGAS